MYRFYRDIYGGSAISEADFPELEKRARDKLAYYQRIYRVTGTEEAQKYAICAMAEAIAYFETAQNGQGGLRYASVGTVSVSGKGIYSQVDISPKAMEQALYRCARLYLDICRVSP